jgi:uncharacterized circularly permuted ATP-grasp superfamily protein/uncharacterized alpha-E superfamily protein
VENFKPLPPLPSFAGAGASVGVDVGVGVDGEAADLSASGVLRQAQAAPSGAWDEMRGGLGPFAQAQAAGYVPLSQPWSEFLQHLGPQGLADMNPRMAQLERQVRDNGISYNVYADADRPQRPWSLDLFPLMVDALSWQQIEAGVLQRMRLLEHIMADTYGPQRLVKTGMLPTALVQGHPGYLHAMQGAAPVGGQHLALAAFDLARGPDGCWWMMSQRTEAPSGLGYLLENRLIISRQFPQAFEAMPVQRLAEAYRGLVDGLKQRSPGGADAHIALLTPGPYNETYFEHAYLARYLGLTLVQGGDLLVRHQKLYLKTLQGLQRVHGLLKRVDDAWLDPLELRADSTLGVPGLLQAVRAGNVLVANAPGSGFLESSALLGFMPALAKAVLGEELKLPAIQSWWCGERSAMQQVLPRMADCVIKPSYPAFSGRHSFEPVMGRNLSQRERDEWSGRIFRDGTSHTLQAFLPVSHTPVWQADAAAPAIGERPVILRVFALANAQGGWSVLPGGLARLGTREGIASMQRGGSSADVWVLARRHGAAQVAPAQSQNQTQNQSQTPLPSHDQTPPLFPSLSLEQTQAQAQGAGQGAALSQSAGLARQSAPSGGSLAATPSLLPALAQAAHRQRIVTSRAAENLFWMGRYTERSENTLRLTRLALDVLGSEDQSCAPLVAWLNHMAVSHGLVVAGVPAAQQSRRVFERSLVAGLWDTQHTTGVGFNLNAVFLAASCVRERLSPEHWSLIEQAQNTILQPDVTDRHDPVQAQRVLVRTSQLMAALTGAQTDRMSRDDGWRLLSIGRHIERLDFLAYALASAVRAGALQEQAGFDAVLALFDSTISFHAQYQQSRTVGALLELLLTNADNPRALAWVAHTLRGRLARMAGLADGRTQALADRVPKLVNADLRTLCPDGFHTTPTLLSLLQDCRDAAHATSDSLNALFFAHSGESSHSVGA